MFYDPHARRGRWIVCLAFVFGVWLCAADSLTAQSRDTYQNREYGQQRPSQMGNHDGSELPEWAAPSRSTSRGSGRKGESGLDGQMQTRMPNPDEPTVPVDGGIGWLLLAGLGYAGWKLGLVRQRPGASA